MVELGLNQHHQLILVSYMKFAKYMRSQSLKQIQHSFEDIETRLFEDTYTKQEVKEIFSDLEKIIVCDVESELINFSHNNVLMLKQLFTQAEKWYLRLEIDVSELQNQEELEMIKLLESDETQLQVKPGSNDETSTEEGSVALLKMEIERLKEENTRLTNVIQDAEDMADLYKGEKNKLGEKLLNAHKEISKYKDLMDKSQADADSETVRKMEEKLSQVQHLLSLNAETLEEHEEAKVQLKAELATTREKVKQVEAQLHLAETELEKKFSETKAYANMKQILLSKNEKIKELRQALAKYEPEPPES